METQTQYQKIAAIILMAQVLGFELVTSQQNFRNEKIRTIDPPNTARGKEWKKRISLKKDLGNLTIYLHIPVDPETYEFVKKGALFWIIVTDSFPKVKTKRYYREPFSCIGDFVKRITHHLTAVEYRIKQRPVSELTKKPKAMLPYRDSEGRLWFVAREKNKIVDKKKFFIGLPADPDLIKYINKWQNNKVGITKRRKKNKSTSASKSRKPYEITPVIGPIQTGKKPNPVQLQLKVEDTRKPD